MEKVTSDIYRGKRPDVTDLRIFAKMGIKSVLSLEDDPVFALHEMLWCRKEGLVYFNKPTSEWKAPSVDYLLAANLSLRIIVKPVFVHCKHGCDRAGYVIAAYRMLECGWSFRDAWRECVKYGHKWYLLPWWIPSLLKLKKCIEKKTQRR